VSDFSPFTAYDEALELTTSLSQEGGNNEDIQAQGHGEEELDQDIPDLGGPMTKGGLERPKRYCSTRWLIFWRPNC